MIQWAGISAWFLANWQWIITFLLLVTSVGLGISSYLFQRRTAVRESLEQLDHESVGGGFKLIPMIHSFNFFPPNRGIVLYIQLKRPQRDGSGSAVSRQRNFTERLRQKEADLYDLKDNLEDIGGVELVNMDMSGAYIDCSTLDSIQIREIAVLSMITIGEKF